MTSARRNKTRIVGLVFAAAALACTVDDPQVSQVGAVTVFAVNPSNAPQQIEVAPGAVVDGNRMQTAIWTIAKAELFIGADPDGEDLLFDGTDCRIADTPLSSALSLGDCSEFLVLESFAETDAVQATLMLSFKVRLKRVKPPVFRLIGDYDGDGILNGNDNCVLIANPGQEDTGGLGFGDACRVFDAFAGTGRDNDADGVTDVFDNCVHIANPLQVNPPSADYPEIESIVSDGIGLACEPTMPGSSNTTGFEEQIIDLPLPGTMPEFIDVAIPFGFVLPQAEAFVVIDFDDEIVFPNCEWDLGTCSGFDPNAITVCIETSAAAASQGCS